tara:strand:+ start:340 stop:627 length:288 start_codon:yes stop_codon:yes gene_type:complete
VIFADLLACAFAVAVLASAIAAPIASARGKIANALGWSAFLAVSGIGLAALQYDGRGRFLLFLAIGTLFIAVSIVNVISAYFGRSRRKRASQSNI